MTMARGGGAGDDARHPVAAGPVSGRPVGAEALLWGDPASRPYMLVDAARDPAIHPALVAHQDELEMMSLYQGELAVNLADVAPYIVALERGAPFGRWLMAQARGRSWGIFIRSRLGLTEVRRKVRRFNVASTEDGRSMMFRYYDPRVLRVFLPIATPDQLARLFDGVDAYYAENESGDSLIGFEFIAGDLRSAGHPLADDTGA